MTSVLTRTHAPDRGPRVRVRLARRADHPAVAALLRACGVTASDLEIKRLLSYHPLHRSVLLAFAPIDGAERLVGLGAIDLREDAEPDTVVVDESVAGGLGPLLGSLLAERAAARASRVA